MEPFKVSQNDIEAFRKWLVKIPYLPQNVDDTFIAVFIHGSKRRLERAKSKFSNFAYVPTKYPECFLNLDPDEQDMVTNGKAGYLAISPKLNDDGSLVTCAGIVDPNPCLFSHFAFLRCIHMAVLTLIIKEGRFLRLMKNWNGKIHFVLDCSQAKMVHFAYTPTQLKALAEFLTICLPFQLAGIHILNISYVAEKFFNFFKQFLKAKIANRIYFHENSDQLFKIISKDCLVEDVGGNLPQGLRLQQDLISLAKSCRDELIAWSEKTQELAKLRPRDTEDEIVGSFKKLEVD